MECILESQVPPSRPLKRKETGTGTGDSRDQALESSPPDPLFREKRRKRTQQQEARPSELRTAQPPATRDGKRTQQGARPSFAEVAKTPPATRDTTTKRKEGPDGIPVAGVEGTGRGKPGKRGANIFAPSRPRVALAPAIVPKNLPPRCYRCRRFGHIRTACRQVAVDYWGRCHRCGGEGHGARWCQRRPHCLLCAEEDREEDHWAGGLSCPGIPKERTRSGGKKKRRPMTSGRGSTREVRGSVRPRRKEETSGAAKGVEPVRAPSPSPERDLSPMDIGPARKSKARKRTKEEEMAKKRKEEEDDLAKAMALFTEKASVAMKRMEELGFVPSSP